LPNTSEEISSFHQTDSSSSRTHKSDFLPNFGVNTCHIEVPDGHYELVPEPKGEPAKGDVIVVKVQQDPNQISEEL
jgi:hypothetical protein